MANEAIPAATLILVREPAGGPPELLMVERSPAMAFAPGATVFPGGRIDRSDAELALRLGHDDGGARVAAIRETLEECGVAVGVHPQPATEQGLALQDALLGGAEFAALLEAGGFQLNSDSLTPFTRWVPGPEVGRRFDTRFFLARSDTAAGTPRAGSGECVSARWTGAETALREERRGTLKLIYPTRKNLERLAQFTSFDDMLADAQSRPVVPITAKIENRGGETYVVIPKGLGYPITSDALDQVHRG